MTVTKDPKKGKRRNVAPQSPRFLPPAQMRGEGNMSDARKKAIKKESIRARKEERKARRKVKTAKPSQHRRGPTKLPCNVSGKGVYNCVTKPIRNSW